MCSPLDSTSLSSLLLLFSFKYFRLGFMIGKFLVSSPIIAVESLCKDRGVKFCMREEKIILNTEGFGLIRWNHKRETLTVLKPSPQGLHKNWEVHAMTRSYSIVSWPNIKCLFTRGLQKRRQLRNRVVYSNYFILGKLD